MRSHAPITATAALLLLALTGCTSTPATTAGESTAPEASAPSSPSPTPTVAPLVAETPAGIASGTPQDQFLAIWKTKDHANSQIPNATDAQLLSAADKACEQMATGADVFSVRVIDGETPDPGGYFGDSTLIASIAQQTICPA